MTQVITWSLVAAIVMTFVGYPVVISVVSRFAPPRRYTMKAFPSVSILIGAYNEAAHIGEKLESVMAAVRDYPAMVEILVGDDGSSDATAAIVNDFAAQGVTLLCLPRGGKAAALNALVPIATGEILVLTDADPLFVPDTLRHLIKPFSDPRVGAVAGAVETLRGADKGGYGKTDSLYRAYESGLREAEDRLFGCISADGGLYAIRSSLMPVVPADGTDDFHISTAAVAAGYRIAFAADAKVFEHPIIGDAKNMRRRIRITVRGLTALWRRRGLLNPMRTGGYAAGLFFHKVARRFVPLLFVPLSICAVILAIRGYLIWQLFCIGLAAFALLVLAGLLARRRLPKLLAAAYLLALHLTGLAAGVCLFLAGRRYAQWTPQKG